MKRELILGVGISKRGNKKALIFLKPISFLIKVFLALVSGLVNLLSTIREEDHIFR